jgi:hypothetical protein
MNVNDIGAVFTHTCAQAFALTLLYYDHILTFPAEVSHMWSQPISANTLLFLSNRYVALFGNTIVPITNFSGLIDSTSCTSATHVRQALMVLSQVLVSMTLSVRVIALYHSSRPVIVWVAGCGTILACITFWSLVGQHATLIRDTPGCYYLISETTYIFTALFALGHTSYMLFKNSGIHLAFAWEAQALFDALVFTLTVTRTLKMRKLHNMEISLSGKGLLDVFLRDGAIYFAVMALANLANIFTFYFSRPALKGFLSTPASWFVIRISAWGILTAVPNAPCFLTSISVTLCSRLVLHLYEVATPASSASESSVESNPTVNLTTRIELGTCMDDRSVIG